MRHLHKLGLNHGDLRAENIMLNSFLNAKIINLKKKEIINCLYKNKSDNDDDDDIVDFVYQAPEFNNSQVVDKFKCDVYSFGVLLHFLLFEKCPCFSKNKMVDFDQYPHACELSKIVISKCMSDDYKKRPTFEDILNLIRSKKYSLASDIDEEFVSSHDRELRKFD